MLIVCLDPFCELFTHISHLVSMSLNYSSYEYKTPSHDNILDNLPMLGHDTEAPNHSKPNTSLALNSFESPVGDNQFTRDPLACRKKLFADDV